jgi:hypothetical protein
MARALRTLTACPLPAPQWSSAANMALIAFGVLVCALGEANLVMKGLLQQLVALGFEVRRGRTRSAPLGSGSEAPRAASASRAWPTPALATAGRAAGLTLHACLRVPAAAVHCWACLARCCPMPLQAARLTLVQILINARGLAMNPLQSLYYVSPACLLCLAVPFGGCPAS